VQVLGLPSRFLPAFMMGKPFTRSSIPQPKPATFLPICWWSHQVSVTGSKGWNCSCLETCWGGVNTGRERKNCGVTEAGLRVGSSYEEPQAGLAESCRAGMRDAHRIVVEKYVLNSIVSP